MEKINNTEELKIKFEEKQNEYDKLLTRIDRLKDTIYELTTKYNVDKETKKRKFFNRMFFIISAIVFILSSSICKFIADFSFLESVAIAFMTILMSCDGIFVVSNNSADSKVAKDGILENDRQTIDNCEKHLNELLTEKNTLKVERDNTYVNYSKNVTMLNSQIHVEEQLDSPLQLDDSVQNKQCKRLVKIIEDK